MNSLKSRILDLLRQGMRPEDISLTVALGVTLGTIPILGSTTLLCGGAAAALRLNMPLIMFVNYFVYPVQLLIYIPLLLMGAGLLDSSLKTLTLSGVYEMLSADPWAAIQRLFWANLGAVLIWAVVAGPLGLAVHRTLGRLMTRFQPQGEVNS